MSLVRPSSRFALKPQLAPAWTASLLIAPLLVASVLPASPAGGEVQRDTCHPLAADAIYGRDLSAVVPGLGGLPPEVQVGYAPAPGMERVFAPPELRRLAREYGLDAKGFLKNVCFTWAVEPLTAADIQQSLEKTLAGRNPRLEIISWSSAPAPRGELIFPLSGLVMLSDKPSIWKGYVVYAGAKHFLTWANVRVSIGEPHLILDGVLHAGDDPRSAGIHVELYRGPLPRERALTDPSELNNLVARRDLQPGLTLTESMLEAPKAVSQGDLVSVLVENGAARIETQGVAVQSGVRGEIISILNPKSGRKYRARIEGKGSVVVVPGGASGLVGEDSKETKS